MTGSPVQCPQQICLGRFCGLPSFHQLVTARTIRGWTVPCQLDNLGGVFFFIDITTKEIREGRQRLRVKNFKFSLGKAKSVIELRF